MEDSASNAQTVRRGRHFVGPAHDMDDRHFSEWAMLLEHRVGLFIAPERRSFLASGIKTRMRETGCNDSHQYYNRLLSGAVQAQEWSLLIDQLTVHETCFFRHEASMRLVREQLVPEIFARRNQFLAWSVGCATGEEAYSLAMIADAGVRQLGEGRKYGITGTDISLPSLRLARDGVYLKRRLKDISYSFQQDYCAKHSDRHFHIGTGLRKRVCFSQLNIRDLQAAPMTKMDLIFCQNLLIYFDRVRRQRIVNELCGFLRPGGMLIIGPGELLNWQHSNMEKVHHADTLAYRCTD
ncbi:Chemotaxis protein methyltransferase CheR [hydrothermal vent metagenome]|uniref:protein-glutamate O-methyltransferase n=1 Tax=hydrothermal vent metagenome TaxID=652676 RepID=A0A3B0YVB2_9ZZZZ